MREVSGQLSDDPMNTTDSRDSRGLAASPCTKLSAKTPGGLKKADASRPTAPGFAAETRRGRKKFLKCSTALNPGSRRKAKHKLPPAKTLGGLKILQNLTCLRNTQCTVRGLATGSPGGVKNYFLSSRL
jgi:hypothetical protein